MVIQIDNIGYLLSNREKRLKNTMKMITLRNKSNNQEIKFSFFEDKDLQKLQDLEMFKNYESSHKLEVEFDYDTDSEQINTAKTMMVEDLTEAIEFFIKEDPLKLVRNLDIE